MGTIIASLIAKKAAGHVIGLLASKTQIGATTGAAGGLIVALPGALNGDPNAIGAVVLIVIGWLGALYGRWRAKPAPAAWK